MSMHIYSIPAKSFVSIVMAVNIPIRKYFVFSYTKYLFTALATLATRLSEFLLDGPLVQLL